MRNESSRSSSNKGRDATERRQTLTKGTEGRWERARRQKKRHIQVRNTRLGGGDHGEELAVVLVV